MEDEIIDDLDDLEVNPIVSVNPPKTTDEDTLIDLSNIDLSDMDFSVPTQLQPQPQPPTPSQSDKTDLENKIREQYKHLGEDKDMENIAELKVNRRKFSEKLESDPEFRQQYINQENLKRQKELDKIISKLQNPCADDEREADSDDEYSESLPASDISDTSQKSGVYIQNVDKIVINIHF
jgi:hypothetical protein